MQNLNIEHKRHGVEILVRGTVQGVGFRPFIYNLAARLEVSGTVGNTSDGVIIRAAASEDHLQLFLSAVKEQAPPLARITSIETQTIALNKKDAAGSFSILPSTSGTSARAAIPPDIALCNDCKKELLDPGDRRFGYPFINCTNCGPRFSIVETIPYDRPKTSMKHFPMCPACLEEYHDPGNRRFHAQPNACPDCGPNILLQDRNSSVQPGDPLEGAAAALRDGRVVAIRGLGGFHLAVDGCSNAAITTLRERKGRPDKPLAIMVADLAAAEKFCLLGPRSKELLLSTEHPIVLLKKRENTSLSELLAPSIDEIGLMLAYTPLHQLLFGQRGCPEALVMTSGNISGNPICTGNKEALEHLSAIADLFLLHNRDIVNRVDDSVVRVISDRPLVIRRARGYAPAPVQIPWKLPRMLGCGAGLKNTFCLGRSRSIYPSQHIGDLDNLASYEFYRESIENQKKLLQLEPEAVACDLHPDYLSSRYAEETGLPLYRVQHHHAHAVAVMGEHGLDEPVLAVVLDGTGLGDDGTSWGGEIFRCDLLSYKRLGHLSQLHLPGGDRAATEPWRMALSTLYSTYGEAALLKERLPESLAHLDSETLQVVSSMLSAGFNSPLSSSCGRLFDGVASLLGVRHRISYEGQAAMELESLAARACNRDWLLKELPQGLAAADGLLHEFSGIWQICSTEFVTTLIDGLSRKVPGAILALNFHTTLIAAIASLIEKLRAQTGIDKVVLSGGCIQNSLLLTGLLHCLKNIDVQVFTGNSLPVNDGAVSFGQTITGGLLHVSRNSNAGDQRPG